MHPGPFLVIEIHESGIPGNRVPGTRFTREHPDVQIDMITEPRYDRSGETYRPVLFMVRGANTAMLEDFHGRLGRIFGRLQPLRNDLLRRVWIGRGTVKQKLIDSEAMQHVMAFQDRCGAPWLHLQGGVLHMRARVRDARDADHLAQEMRTDLAAAGIEAQVDLQEISEHDYSVWNDLVQFSIGLMPGQGDLPRGPRAKPTGST